MPKYRITAPDGKTFDVEGEGTADEALAHIQATYQATPAEPAAPAAAEPQQPQQPQQPYGTPQMAAAETLASVGSSAIAAPLAGLVGLGAAGTKALGLTNAEPADVVRKVQGALTYEPRTQQGQQMAGIVAYPFEKLAQGADYLGGKAADATGSPAVGAAVNTAIQSIPAVALRGRFGNGRSPNRPGGTVAAGEAEAPRPVAPQAGRQPGLAAVSEKPPSIEELKSAKDAAYKRADEAGITITDGSIKGLKTRIVSDMKQGGLNSTLHPDATAAVKQILAAKGDLSLSELETLRKVASDAEGSIKPADARLAGKVVDHIDNLMENLTQKDVVSGSPEQALALKEARGLYTRMKKAETINELFRRAELSAPNFSGSGMENALRTEFRSLAKNAQRMRRFNPEERAAIEKVAKGGPTENILRMVGKMAPTGVVSASLGSGLGAMIGGPIGAAAVPAVGFASRTAATRMTMRNATAAEELMRRGPQGNAMVKPKTRNALVEP